MKVDLPKYPEYKGTSSDLISHIPASWDLKRLKFLMPYVLVGIVITPSKYYAEKGIPAIRSLNVKGGLIVDQDLVFFSEADNEKLKKTQIYEGDLVIVRSGQTGACAVVDKRFDGANCIDLIIIRKSEHLSSEFLKYFLSSKMAKAQIFTSSNGAIQQHFNVRLVRELLIVEPTRSEQRDIVAFLDSETAKIDQLMKVRQKQIERLQEQRVAVIYYAVTKGLDANAPMSSSGVEWLGDIPAHWECMRIKRLSIVRRGASPRPIDDPKYFDDEGTYSWVRISDVTESERYLEVTEQKLSKLGSSLSVKLQKESLFVSICASVGKPIITKIKCCIHDGFVYFPRLKHNPEFFYYLFKSGEPYKGLGNWGTQLNLNTGIIGSITVCLPPPEEQDAIVTYLDHETGKIDALIDKYNRELELLAEYRESLISHAVMGKIDVRDLVETSASEAAGVL